MTATLAPMLLDEVAAFLASLPLLQQQALHHRKYERLSYAEIARDLQCSEEAARDAVYSALRQLRDRFGDQR